MTPADCYTLSIEIEWMLVVLERVEWIIAMNVLLAMSESNLLYIAHQGQLRSCKGRVSELTHPVNDGVLSSIAHSKDSHFNFSLLVAVYLY